MLKLTTIGLCLMMAGSAMAQNKGDAGSKPDTPADPAAVAAHAAGEPSLKEILDKLGYEVNPVKDEVQAERFVRAGKGPIIHRPIAAYGLIKDCTSGWYPAAKPAASQDKPERPDKRLLWTVEAKYNKQASPPLKKDDRTAFDPGREPFGLWVSTAGFTDETVCTEDALQGFVPRFKSDHHKAHVYPAKRGGKVLPNTYIIGWEYSTNNDNQDIVTLVSNVKPVER